jgi:acyl-CoA thioesterase FadM
MLRTTHTSSVTEDQIDHLGHMNVRFYGVNAHAATNAVLAEIDGWPRGPHLVRDTYTRHHREQLLGTPLLVRSGLLSADADGLRIHHELVPANAEALAATFVHRVSPIDEGGLRLPVPDAVVAAARAEAIEPLPYAVPRTIDLDLDPLASAPSLAVLRERGLDVRKERTITDEECDERGRYRPEATMMLLWAGELPDHVEGWGPDLHEGPDGERMGWALMETRVQLDRLPHLGTRIQSFGATIALHERATHRVHWCYDLDGGELLCAFEAVDVAFDTVARRTMVIPDSIRRRQESVLHADLAPRRTEAR